MKRVMPLLGACLLATPVVFAAENERGVSVYDANPKCMERTTNSAVGECILFQEGVPRQYYPVNVMSIPNPPVMPPPPQVAQRGTTPATTPRKGG